MKGDVEIRDPRLMLSTGDVGMVFQSPNPFP